MNLRIAKKIAWASLLMPTSNHRSHLVNRAFRRISAAEFFKILDKVDEQLTVALSVHAYDRRVTTKVYLGGHVLFDAERTPEIDTLSLSRAVKKMQEHIERTIMTGQPL